MSLKLVKFALSAQESSQENKRFEIYITLLS